MDNLTHTLAGALIGAACGVRRAPDAAPSDLGPRLLLGAIAANLPDLDLLVTPFVDPFANLNLHRGITHSAVMLPLWTLSVAWVAARLARGRLSFPRCFVVAGLALASHVALDALTAYGTHLLAPLDDHAFAWPVIFIVDLWLTGLLVLGLGVALWRRSASSAWAALGTVAVYVGFLAYQSTAALEIARGFARADERASVLPQPLSPAHWKLVLAGDEAYRIAHLDLWSEEADAPSDGDGFFARLGASYRPRAALAWDAVPYFGGVADDAEFAREAWAREELAEFRRFTALPALVGVERAGPERCAAFTDLRFHLPVTGRDPFRAAVCARPDGDWHARRVQGCAASSAGLSSAVRGECRP